MTEVVLESGILVYTELSESEVRSIMQLGNKTGSFKAYLDSAGTKEVEVAVGSIKYVNKSGTSYSKPGNPVSIKADTLKAIGYAFSAASTDETVLAKPTDGNLGITFFLVEVPGGLTSPTITLKDGTTEIGTWAVPSGDAKTLISSANPLELDGDLVAQVSSTGITISTWCSKI